VQPTVPSAEGRRKGPDANIDGRHAANCATRSPTLALEIHEEMTVDPENTRTRNDDPLYPDDMARRDEATNRTERVDVDDDGNREDDEVGAEAMGAGAGALGGAAIGGAVAGPPGAVVGGIAGAAAGGLTGEAIEGDDEVGATAGGAGGTIAGAGIGGAVGGPPGAVVGGAGGAGAGAGIRDNTE